MPADPEPGAAPPSPALASVLARFASHPGLRAKAALGVLPGIFGPTDWVAGPGDDAAAIPDASGYLLAAAEAIWPPFVASDPRGAGIASVVANVNDIAAMGGRSVAMTNTVVAPDGLVADVLQGMRSACALYGVPMVGGHLSVLDGPPSVSAFILGRASALLSSRNVAPGQVLLVAWCLEGHLRADFAFFSSVAERGSDLAGDVEVLAALAEAGSCVAAKDISMAGLLGSLAMLLEATGAGAVVDLDRVPAPAGVGLEEWLFAFPNFGFLLCSAPDRAEDCRAAFIGRGLACEAVGMVEPTGRLRVRLGGASGELLDFATAAVTGLGGAGAKALLSKPR